jgi:FkbM family methyltransferase
MIINITEFDVNLMKLSYHLQDGIEGDYRLKIIDEKTNGVCWNEIGNLKHGISYFVVIPHAKSFIYQNIKIIFEFNNKIVCEALFKIHENYNKNIISDLYFDNFDVNINTYHEVLNHKVYSQFEIEVEKDDIVVDIGANFGAFIKLAIDSGCKEIYSCEPDSNCNNAIEKIFNKNKNLHINRYAISNFNGFTKLSVPLECFGSSSSIGKLIESTVDSGLNYSENSAIYTTVETITFQDFIKKNNLSKIDYLKVDCEGGENFIFNEINIKYIKDNVHKIAIEYHNKYRFYLHDLLLNSGFTVYADSFETKSIGMMYARNKNWKHKNN